MFRNLLSKIDGGRPFKRHEFNLLDWPMRFYVRGNFSAFGLWAGLRANITLMCPLLNTLLNLNRRNKQLWFVNPDTGRPYDKIQEDGIINTVKSDQGR